MNKNKIISEHQFGFLSGIGTKQALHKVTELIYNGLNEGNAVVGTFLDLSKAFDTVNHQILLKKLERYGVRGTPLNLFKNYLQNRQHAVRLGDTRSEYKPIDIGVPQGSILGPYLFLIYINDLLSLAPHIFSYADDTAVFALQKNWILAKNIIIQSLNSINIWFVKNKLTLNLNKSMYITFGIKRNSLPDNNFSIKIANHNLTRVSSCKYLGIYFDQHMRWDIHVNNTLKKVKYLLFIFYKLRHINKSILKIIYYSLFLGVVAYAISVWGCAYDNALKILQSFQNKIIKVINIDNVQFHSVRQMYKLNSLSYYYKELVALRINSTYSDRTDRLKLPNIHKDIYKKSPYVTSLKLYNSLPHDAKNLSYSSTKALKTKLLDFLQNELHF